MTDYSIRPARPGEQARLSDIEASASLKFRGSAHAAVVGRAEAPEVYAPYIARGDVFVAVHSGSDDPVGFIVMALRDAEPFLAELDVDGDHQGRGVGRLLMAAAEDWARARGAQSLLLTTFGNIPWNGPYYQRLGFEYVPLETCDGPDMRAQREHERENGLDISDRVIMRKRF